MNQQRLMQKLGSRVKALRLVNKFTQIDLAAIVDVDVRTINRIESGTYNPTLKIISGLASAFEISISDLFKEID